MHNDRSRLWVLAMNSARARIIRGLRDNDSTDQTELVMRSEARKLRDLMADLPGRSFASKGGGRRSAMDYGSDPLAEDQRDFIRQVISLLESHRRADDFSELAVFAEHDVLGKIRQLMPDSLRARVIKEVPKNLLHLTAQDLPRVIAREMGNSQHAR